MTNREMSDALLAMKIMAREKMPLKTGLKVRSAIRSLEHLAGDVEAERQKLVEQYAERNEDGSPKVTDLGNGKGKYEFGENLRKFDADFNELMSLEVAGMPAPIKASELGDLEIQPELLVMLGELLADE